MSLPREFLYELHKNFTGDIRTDFASCVLYSTDASIYQIEPLGVVIPRTQEELHAAVELAARYKIPFLPRGAGTSLAGQAIGNALILDCSRWLDHIIEINTDERYAVVEPGVVLSDLNNAAAKYGLMFGPDPASAERATMGGVIANNATGAHSILYGMSADHVIAADVILGDGSLETWDGSAPSKLTQTALAIRGKYAVAIKNNWTQTWRNSAGYRLNYLLPWSPSKPARWEGEYPPIANTTINLAPLLAGSEGTLAVIRRAKVNLVPKPKHTILAVLSYLSVAEACDDVPRLLTHNPSAIELIPNTILRAARSVPAYARQMGWVVPRGDAMGDPEALLIVEFSGDQPQALKEAARGLDTLANTARYSTTNNKMVIAESKEEQAQVWSVRKVGLGLMDSKPQPARPVAFIEDCAIPVERLGEFVREVEKILSTHGTEGGIYAHASAGCLHIRPILDLKTARGVTDLRAISEAVLSLTLSLGGAMSSEHGDGLARSEHLARAYGSEVMGAMRMLKDAADPHHLLNPGKIIDPQKMDVNLRYGIEYQTREWKSSLSFERNDGFALAVEQCNGQGVCRKLALSGTEGDSGVMCPSYQATREEMHSTRGRANLLRAMISLPHPESLSQRERGWGEGELTEATARALDLCLACKGCKAECPSGVDMAKLKYEFENEYYKTHRRPLRDYVFGYFHVVAGLLAPVAPLANGMMNVPWIKNIVANVLGITTERPFPKFVRWRAKVLATENTEITEKKRIIFLPDVFSRYIEPQVEQAVFDVLSKCGYDVHVLPVVGAGASLLSKGFVDAARRHARKALDLLNQIDPTREAVIVGVEPPEIYLLKNDYVDLVPERAEEINQRAEKTWLLDEFLLRSEEFSALRVGTLANHNTIEKKKQKIKFHPHCHQRAEGLASDGIASGSNASVELLRACGYGVELIDAGCCGMAGTFGYEAEHYDLSMKVGELKLFPKLTPSQPPPNPKKKVDVLIKESISDLGEAPKAERVASTGAACRMQILQGAGVVAEHPVLLLRERLGLTMVVS